MKKSDLENREKIFQGKNFGKKKLKKIMKGVEDGGEGKLFCGGSRNESRILPRRAWQMRAGPKKDRPTPEKGVRVPQLGRKTLAQCPFCRHTQPIKRPL
jgi:hypothetical protein